MKYFILLILLTFSCARKGDPIIHVTQAGQDGANGVNGANGVDGKDGLMA